MSLLSEYGIFGDSVRDAVALCQLRPSKHKLHSDREFVRACRAFARRNPDGCVDPGTDARLVARGWNVQSPRVWMTEGLPRFLRYWDRAADRPRTVGSEYNPDPAYAFAAIRLGMSAFTCRAITHTGIFPLVRALAAGKPVRDIGRGLARRKRESYRAALAVRRHSISSSGRSWSPKTLAILGRLSPELQAAAVAAVLRSVEGDQRIVMPRHLHAVWGEVARVRDQMRARPVVRIAWRSERRLMRDCRATAMLRDSTRASFPKLNDYMVSAKLIRGETPVSISGGILTRREAHGWLSEGAELEPLDWLVRCLPYRDRLTVRDAHVARWLVTVHDRGQWEQLTRTREIAGPRGQRLRVRFIDKLDEIMPEDLVDGMQTTVSAAFEHAAKRAGDEYQNRLLEDHRVISSLPAGWRLYGQAMRHLATRAELAAEGQEMQHCVGTYASAVESGDTIILSISVLGHRSTVELSKTGVVRQHRSSNNRDPHPLCERLLEKFLRFRIAGRKARAA